MEIGYSIPSRKEFLFIALLLFVINTIAIIPENVDLVSWSRFVSTIILLGYLIIKHHIYLKTSFLIGFIFIALSDFCLIFFEYFVVSVLFILLSLGGFGFYLWNIVKSIEWKIITFSNVLMLVLLLCFKFYLVFFMLELLSSNIDPILYILFYFYAAVSIVFTFIAGLAYLQTDKAGNEHLVIVPYAYLISNTFLGLALYSDNYWGHYLSRFFYLITVCVLAHYIVQKLYNDYVDLIEVDETEIKN